METNTSCEWRQFSSYSACPPSSGRTKPGLTHCLSRRNWHKRTATRQTRPYRGRGLLAYWPLDGDTRDTSGSLNHATASGKTRFVDGKFDEALELSNGVHLIVPCSEGESPDAELFRKLKPRFDDDASLQQMDWEREDGCWIASKNWSVRPSAGKTGRPQARLSHRGGNRWPPCDAKR